MDPASVAVVAVFLVIIFTKKKTVSKISTPTLYPDAIQLPKASTRGDADSIMKQRQLLTEKNIQQSLHDREATQ